MNIITKIYTKTTLTGLQVMVVQPDFMWVVVFSSRGSCRVWEVIPDPDPSSLPAPGTSDISGGGVPQSMASRRALLAAVMGEGGASRLPIKDGVYPALVSSGWKVPTGVSGSPVFMGRCIDSTVNTDGESTSIASAASIISGISLPVRPGSARIRSWTTTASSVR